MNSHENNSSKDVSWSGLLRNPALISSRSLFEAVQQIALASQCVHHVPALHRLAPLVFTVDGLKMKNRIYFLVIMVQNTPHLEWCVPSTLAAPHGPHRRLLRWRERHRHVGPDEESTLWWFSWHCRAGPENRKLKKIFDAVVVYHSPLTRPVSSMLLMCSLRHVRSRCDRWTAVKRKSNKRKQQNWQLMWMMKFKKFRYFYTYSNCFVT